MPSPSLLLQIDKVAARLTTSPVALLSFASLVFLTLGIGQDGLSLDATTYAVIARDMVENGHWFSPSYTSFVQSSWAEHPPLVLWGHALMFLLFGASDSATRFFGALCTLGSVLMVFKLTEPLIGRVKAILSGLVLLLTYNFMQMGNSALLDGPMTFFVLVVLYGLMRMQRDVATRRDYLLTGVALGSAFLSKGVVSAPVWLALILTVLLYRRDWLRMPRFWILPSTAFALIGLYLLLDQIYADGYFRHYYFGEQVWGKFQGERPDLHNPWYNYLKRLATLYLPFIVLLPVGIYFVLRRRLTLLYPLLMTFGFYLLFYSIGARVYYHYFIPAYALAAPIVAVALDSWLSETGVRRIVLGFLFLWLMTGLGVTVAGVRIHTIRSPEIYELKEEMRQLLKGHATRYGLVLGSGHPDWDWLAKTSWYWWSDIRQVATLAVADSLIGHGNRYAYLLVTAGQVPIDSGDTANRWRQLAGNDRITVYTINR